jgi:hypothetical protein
MRILAPILLVFGALAATAQSNYVTVNADYYHWIDRYEVKSGHLFPQIFTAVKPYKRSDIVAFADSAFAENLFSSRADQFNYEYLRNDSWEWSQTATNDSRKPILKHFYKKKSDFFHVQVPDFDLHISPVLYAGLGQDSRLDDKLYLNTRGVEVRGMVDQKVGFYMYLADNQALLPSYVQEDVSRTDVIPHEGFWKRFKDGAAVDFLQARGYLTFEATKHINLQFGHDRFFIGNGHRSMIFSDNGPPSLFLKANAKVWKLNYLFFLTRMAADKDLENGKYPQKFVAFHHVSLNIGKKLNIGLFEAVVFTDSGSFEMSYLNPVIFYRGVEQQFGSSDNVLLGADFKWNALKGVQVYGQFVLDEFVLDEIKSGNGWWANKFAIQAGVKYIDAFGIPNLDLQAETNIVRPFTYSHFTKFGSYSNFRQPIAHPLGANFKEYIGIMRYQPHPRLNLTGKLILVKTGRDPVGENYGGDILKINTTRTQEYGNTIGQGVANDILYGSFTASWQFKHNLFIDATGIFRDSQSDDASYNNNATITSLAVRWNIAQRLYEF